MTAKEQCEILLDKLLPFAEQQMKKYREFYPFAAVLQMDDTAVLTAICEIIQSSAIAYGLTDPEDDITEEWREW